MKNYTLFSISILFLILLVGGVSAVDISTCQDLQDMNNDVTANYVIINDIDCTDFKGFVPIGDWPSYFTGTLNGQNYTISNLQITSDWAGLFAYLKDGAEVRNIRFVNPVITMGKEGGVLANQVGMRFGDVIAIENIYVEGGIVNGGTNEYSGGLIGWVKSQGTTINNAHFEGTVYGAGGLIGQNNGQITGSSFSGDVDGTLVTIMAGPNYDKQGLTGGLTGWNFGTIGTSYSEGTVIGENNVGGLVGGNENFGDPTWPGKIENSYSTANVTGADYKGGLIGYNVAGDIIDSYSTGTVTDSIVAAEAELMSLAMNTESTTITGGFLAYIVKAYECYNSFWDTDISGQTWSACAVNGLSTQEMQDPQTYIDAEWDQNLWFFPTTDYPCLLWEESCEVKQFCSRFIISEDRRDPNRKACEQADWKDNENTKKPEDCYLERNDRRDPDDDVCLPTPSPN